MGKLVRYLESRKLASGTLAYYWNPPTVVKNTGTFKVEALGTDLEFAVARAKSLNEKLDEWRESGKPKKAPSLAEGTVAWLFNKYLGDERFSKLAPKTQLEYRKCIRYLCEYETKPGSLFGSMRLHRVRPGLADEVYNGLRKERGLHLANAITRVASRVWNVGYRWEEVDSNPWYRLERTATEGRSTVWSPQEIALYVQTAKILGVPSMGLAVMLAYELVQRQGDVLNLTWAKYNKITGEAFVRQRKTDMPVWVPASPELRKMLDAAPRYEGVDHVVVCEETQRPYLVDWFRKTHQKIRRHAGLDADLRFQDLRRTGATELGDAEATEDEIMAVGGWSTRQVVSVYVKKTQRQAENAMKKRWAKREAAE